MIDVGDSSGLYHIFGSHYTIELFVAVRTNFIFGYHFESG